MCRRVVAHAGVRLRVDRYVQSQVDIGFRVVCDEIVHVLGLDGIAKEVVGTGDLLTSRAGIQDRFRDRGQLVHAQVQLDQVQQPLIAGRPGGEPGVAQVDDDQIGHCAEIRQTTQVRVVAQGQVCQLGQLGQQGGPLFAQDDGIVGQVEIGQSGHRAQRRRYLGQGSAGDRQTVQLGETLEERIQPLGDVRVDQVEVQFGDMAEIGRQDRQAGCPVVKRQVESVAVLGAESEGIPAPALPDLSGDHALVHQVYPASRRCFDPGIELCAQGVVFALQLLQALYRRPSFRPRSSRNSSTYRHG